MDSEANTSLSEGFESCATSITSHYLFAAWFTVYLLFLPVFLFVLYIGFNKWKKPQSSASGGLSHSDVFTLNMVAMEVTSIAGSCVTMYGYFGWDLWSLRVGGSSLVITVSGQTLFHCLTCVERYLAVVHPVAYLRLRGEGGVTVRNISIALVWVFSVVYCLPTVILNTGLAHGITSFVAAVASLLLVAYCSIFVLKVLIRPKPGEGGGQRKQIDQSKRTTVCTMVAILGALLLRLVVYVVTSGIIFRFSMQVDDCALIIASLWPGLPSSLVLPLLFLHRTRNK